MNLRDWSLRRWALVIALIILLPLIGLRLHLKWRVHRAVAELRAAGHPTTFAELNRRRTLAGNQPNLVAALTNAVSRIPLNSELDETIRNSLPIVGNNLQPPGSAWDARRRSVTREYLFTNHEAIRAIHAAVAITNASGWLLCDPNGWDLYGLIATRRAADHLLLEAAFATEIGELDFAASALVAVLRLAERFYNDPIMSTQLARVRFQEDALLRLEELLSTGMPAAGGLVELRDILRALNSQVSLAHVYRGELVHFLEPYFHHSRQVYIGAECDRGTFEDYKQQMKVLAYRLSGLADQDILYAIQADSEIATRAVSLTGLVNLANQGSAFRPAARGLRFHYWSEEHFANLMEIGGGIVGSRLSRFVENHARLDAADATLAVAQYRLQHDGELPASLGELVPEFLEAAPIEPQSGKPFELIAIADGYGIGRGTPVFSVKMKSLTQEEPR